MDAENLVDPGSAPDAAQLARDAELVADYAARVGKLPAGCRIFHTIDAFNKARAAGHSADRRTLYAELAQVAKAIHPATLAKLKKRGTVQGRIRSAFVTGVPFLLGMMTLSLTFYLAFQSSELQKADTALREYQQWADEKPREKVYQAWKMFRYEKVFNDTKPPLAQLDVYNHTVAEARRLVDKGAAIQELLLKSQTTLYLPRFWEDHGPQWLRNWVRALNWDVPTDEQALGPDVELVEPPSENCPVMLRALFAEGAPAKALPVQDMRADIESQKCFWQLLRIDGTKADYSPFTSIYPIKSKVNLLTVWLLPCLYGLLGACVYLMRDFVLLGGLRRLNRDTTFLNTLALVLRIALGGLAGIIIGWFWIPASAAGNVAPIAISSVPFGLSFLAGFSIETLFSLIDRLKSSIDRPETPAAPDARAAKAPAAAAAP